MAEQAGAQETEKLPDPPVAVSAYGFGLRCPEVSRAYVMDAAIRVADANKGPEAYLLLEIATRATRFAMVNPAA